MGAKAWTLGTRLEGSGDPFRSSPESAGSLLGGARCAYQHLQARADSRSVMPLNVLGRTRTTMVL